MSMASEAAEAAGPKPAPGQKPVTVYAPTAEDDARIRALILAELDRRHVKSVARNALELLIAPSIEAAAGSPGYRIVDRNGEERLRAPDRQSSAKTGKAPSRWRKSGKEATAQAEPELSPSVPLTLEELVDEFREKHPDLFGEPPPEPEPVKEPEPAAPSLQDTLQETVHDTLVHAKEAGTRFVETQSTRAKTLAASSAERSRALASAAGETVEGWRSQLDDRLKAYRGGPGEADAKPGVLARLRGRFAGKPSDEVAAPPLPVEPSPARVVIDDDRRSSRLAVMGLGAAAAIAVVVAGVVMVRQGTEQAPTGAKPRQEAAAQPKPVETPPPETQPPAEQQAANQPQTQPQDTAQVPNAQPLPPDVDPEAQPDEPASADTTELAGVPEVIDTATLKLRGKVVKLFGVEWTRGGQSEELKKYLDGRQVTCRPAPASSAYTCLVNRRDLSEVVLFNGGGRASSEASPDLIAAEDHARTERLGVWKR